MNNKTLFYALVLVLGGISSGVRAEEPLSVETSLRRFDGREHLLYGGLTLQRGDWTLRGVAANKAFYNKPGEPPVLHGGGDLELSHAYRLRKGVRAELGAAFSDTAAQRTKLHLTARAHYETPLNTRLTLSVEPRGVLGGTTLLGMELGTRVKLGEESALVASVTPLLSGHNAVGKDTRVTLWEFGFTVTEKKDRGMVVTLAATNTLGTTTGFSLSPSVGGNALVWKVRFVR